MENRVFVDSDVIIDFFTDRMPFANPASVLFDLSEKGKIFIYISAVSVNNIYYILRKNLGHPKAISVIKELTEMTIILATTSKEIVQGLKSDFNDFEDSIQYSTALAESEIEAIITRNIKDYRNSTLPVFTPTNYLKLLGTN